MEQELIIAEILRNKPQGIKLYSPIFGNCTFCYVKDESSDICVRRPYNEVSYFNFDGVYHTGGECLLFPSKEMRDWSKFAWKRGDVLVSNDGGTEVIFDKWYDDTYTNFYSKHYLNSEDENNIKYNEAFLCTTERYSLEDKDTAQTYINTIEKRLGGKLNLETLEIEKQLEFKDGDIVVYGKSVAICRRIYKHTLSFYVTLNEMVGLVFADEVESSEEYRFATDEDKLQLFDALAKEGKAWDAEKKMFVVLKPKCEFKPFDKVLGRNEKDDVWEAELFSHYKEGSQYPFRCIGFSRKYCIPYKGNEYLLGTRNNPEQYNLHDTE